MQQIYLPRLTQINKFIMVAMGSIFILDRLLVALGITSLYQLLSFNSTLLFNGQIHRLFTYWPVGDGLLEVVFNGLLFWFIGSEIEGKWGKQKYLAFMLFCLVGTTIFLTLSSFALNSPVFLVGTRGLISGLLLVYSLYYPDRIFTFMLIIPLPAKYFCALLIAIEIITGLFGPSGNQALYHLTTIALAYSFYRYGHQWNFSRVVPQRKKKMGKSHLSIVKNEEEKEKPRYWQ